jgi:hypothetical protein
LQAVEDDGGVIAEHFDLKLGPSGAMDFVAGREDYSQNGAAVEDLAVWRDVNVFPSHEAVNGGAVVFEPGGVPGFAEVFDLLLQRSGVHNASFDYRRHNYMNEFRRTQERKSRSLVAEKLSSLGMTTLKTSAESKAKARRRLCLPAGRLKAAGTMANDESTSPPFAEKRKGMGHPKNQRQTENKMPG